jgi:ribonucleoside-diphosphate reductase alpha chain
MSNRCDTDGKHEHYHLRCERCGSPWVSDGTPPPTERVRLPGERQGRIHRFVVGKVKVYVETGEYANGRLGEVFLKADKQGTFVSGILDCLSIVTSIALQHGVPLQDITSKLTGTRFEPDGNVDGSQLEHPRCTSVMDYLARWLDARYAKKEGA